MILPNALGVLPWHDHARNADVTLEVDPETGIPIRLIETVPVNNLVLTASYIGWNTDVEISAP